MESLRGPVPLRVERLRSHSADRNGPTSCRAYGVSVAERPAVTIWDLTEGVDLYESVPDTDRSEEPDLAGPPEHGEGQRVDDSQDGDNDAEG